jgi:hypothetical protein
MRESYRRRAGRRMEWVEGGGRGGAAGQSCLRVDESAGETFGKSCSKGKSNSNGYSK